MSVDMVLSRLKGVRQMKPGRWVAFCPAHEDRTPSLGIAEAPNGTVLINDFAGCEPLAVLQAIGLTFGDLFPEHASTSAPLKAHQRPVRPYVSAQARLNVLTHDLSVIGVILSDLDEGQPLTPDIVDQYAKAAGRVLTIAGRESGAP